jgi:hypothetical protein
MLSWNVAIRKVPILSIKTLKFCSQQHFQMLFYAKASVNQLIQFFVF